MKTLRIASRRRKSMLWKTWSRMSFFVAALLMIFCVAAFAQKAPVNKKGNVISIVAVDFPQFNAYKMRLDAEKKAADDYGVKLTVLQPTAVTVDAVVETLTNAITQGFDAIIMEPWSYDPYKEVIELAISKGIPLVNVHVPYPDDTKFISQIYIDNDAYGITVTDRVAQVSGGKANILIMMNSTNQANQVTQRQSILDRCAAKYPGLKVVDTQFTRIDPVTAAQVLEASLKANPEIDTIIFLESGTVTVAADVAKEMGVLNKVKIIGIDDPPDLIASIKKGEVWGSFNQNFQKQGYEAVRNIVDYFTKQPFPHKTDAGIVLITKQNANNYIPDMWKTIAVKGKPYSNLK
jgi:ribose transport system substrate-binding protein